MAMLPVLLSLSYAIDIGCWLYFNSWDDSLELHNSSGVFSFDLGPEVPITPDYVNLFTGPTTGFWVFWDWDHLGESLRIWTSLYVSL